MRKSVAIAVLDAVRIEKEAELSKVVGAIDDLTVSRTNLEASIWHIREAKEEVQNANDRTITAPQKGTVKANVTNTAEAIIREGGPIHRRELLSLLDERGVIVGGEDTMANMSAYLSRDSRFVASGTGIWRLVEQQEQAGEIAAD